MVRMSRWSLICLLSLTCLWSAYFSARPPTFEPGSTLHNSTSLESKLPEIPSPKICARDEQCNDGNSLLNSINKTSEKVKAICIDGRCQCPLGSELKLGSFGTSDYLNFQRFKMACASDDDCSCRWLGSHCQLMAVDGLVTNSSCACSDEYQEKEKEFNKTTVLLSTNSSFSSPNQTSPSCVPKTKNQKKLGPKVVVNQNQSSIFKFLNIFLVVILETVAFLVLVFIVYFCLCPCKKVKTKFETFVSEKRQWAEAEGYRECRRFQREYEICETPQRNGDQSVLYPESLWSRYHLPYTDEHSWDPQDDNYRFFTRPNPLCDPPVYVPTGSAYVDVVPQGGDGFLDVDVDVQGRGRQPNFYSNYRSRRISSRTQVSSDLRSFGEVSRGVFGDSDNGYANPAFEMNHLPLGGGIGHQILFPPSGFRDSERCYHQYHSSYHPRFGNGFFSDLPEQVGGRFHFVLKLIPEEEPGDFTSSASSSSGQISPLETYVSENSPSHFASGCPPPPPPSAHSTPIRGRGGGSPPPPYLAAAAIGMGVAKVTEV